MGLFARPFRKKSLEKKYNKQRVVTSQAFRVTTILLSLAWLWTMVQLLFDPEVANTLLGTLFHALVMLVPFFSTIIPFFISITPSLRSKYLYPLHSFLVAAMALGMGVASSVPNAFRGRPGALLWVVVTATCPTLLYARAVPALVYFHSVHCATAALFFFVLAPMDRFAQSQRHLYLPATWQLRLNTVLSGLVAIVVSTVMCDLMDRTQRRLFMERWEAVRGAKDLNLAKARGVALGRNLLPEFYAEKVFSASADITYAEVSDLVGVLAIRFAPPHPLQSASVALQTLQKTRETVSRLDDLFVRYCGGVAEKVFVQDGLYVVATNVAVPPSDRLSGLDPGQRFLHLVFFSLAATSAVPAARAGLHIGRCASGVLGTSRLTFDIFGDAASTAILLCDAAGDPGAVFCSCVAHAMIPRRSAKWSLPFVLAQPGHGAVVKAVLLHGLHERRLPDMNAPALPHSVPAEPVHLDSPSLSQSLSLVRLRSGGSIGPSTTTATSVDDGREERPSEAETDGGSDLTATGREASLLGLRALPNDDELVSTLTAEPHSDSPTGSGLLASSPGDRALREKETVEANRWTLTFDDPRLEVLFQRSLEDILFSVRPGVVGALLFAAACIQEVTLPEVVRPSSVVLALLCSGLFATQGLLVRCKAVSGHNNLVVLQAALSLGAVTLAACLLTPYGSVWGELRFGQCFIFMVMASISSSRVPISAALILSQTIAIFAHFALIRPAYKMVNRNSLPLMCMTISFGSIALRYMWESGLRKAFLLNHRSWEEHEVLAAEVAKGTKILGSCLPSSIAAAVINSQQQQQQDKEEDRHQSFSPRLGLGLMGAVPDVLVDEWPVLACRLNDLPRFVKELSAHDLVRLIRQFFLVAEAAAADHECEVIRTTGGTVMICPRIEDRNAGLTRDIKIGRVIRVADAILLGAGPLSAFLEGQRSVEICAALAVGPCIGGVVGKIKSFFEFMGPAPSLALFHLENALPGKLHR